ncbi:hypothetical protein BDQ17DRAFT_1390657 [Cyathus striatus]|nr:hypothetical protein BDQ17DRAFT_1390657 [Cyathus striatus]
MSNTQRYELVPNEPETAQWFALKYTDISPDTFAIFDTFPAESGRQAHLTGKIAEVLMANSARLLDPGPQINHVDVLASIVKDTGSTGKTAGLSVGVRAIFEAKPEKVQAVREFLLGALSLVKAEPETPVWYALEFTGTNKFGIVDFFSSEGGRNAHLQGKVAEKLFASAEEFFVGPIDVVKVDVLAALVRT